MRFRTEYEMRTARDLLDPERTALLIGSCFTDNIGQRMIRCRWEAYPNITGVLYNPASIAKILRIVCNPNSILESIEDSIARREELVMSWLADSGCTARSEAEVKERLSQKLMSMREHLKEAQVLIVTFGTAWIYELKERPGYVVSNCHKFPADAFIRRRLSIDEIQGEWNSLIALLKAQYPDLRIIFTVSPVRHLKDGFEGNCRSKAILQLACEGICLANECAEYFPAYEIMNDDLRDYRFYATDLVHPSEMAVDYIWQKFQDRYLSKASQALLAAGEKETKRLSHRPIINK